MKTFQEVRWTDPTVYSGMRSEVPLETIIVALVEEKEALLKKVMELETIAPRKITLADGKTWVWHCPDHLVPATMLPKEEEK